MAVVYKFNFGERSVILEIPSFQTGIIQEEIDYLRKKEMKAKRKEENHIPEEVRILLQNMQKKHERLVIKTN